MQSNVFTIENARAEDRGIYRCIADNTVRPPAWFDSTLYVFFKPIARAIQSSYGQAQNRMFDITIECRVAGNILIRIISQLCNICTSILRPKNSN